MTYFVDLSVYTYGFGDPQSDVVNVGWLDNSHPFPEADTPPDFRAALSKICEKSRRSSLMDYCGVHECEICGDGCCGKEIEIPGKNGITYIAPDMIDHYVIAHRYKPPQEFIEAVLSIES